jgi:signal transduction histidine kinase
LPAASLDERTAAQIVRVQELVDRAMAELRLMISGLRPGVLDQFGLEAALREVADQLLVPMNISVAIESGIPSRLPPEIEVVLFRIAQEAMHNIARHSGARAMTLRIAQTEGEVSMRVHDDGRGFDPAALSERGSRHAFGLAGMRERASLVGGTVRVESAARGGTTVEARLPVDVAGASPDRAVRNNDRDV